MRTSGFQNESYDEEQFELASNGSVMSLETEADAVAAEYLGASVVADGLTHIRVLLEKSLDEHTYDEKETAVAIQELNLRIGLLKR